MDSDQNLRTFSPLKKLRRNYIIPVFAGQRARHDVYSQYCRQWSVDNTDNRRQMARTRHPRGCAGAEGSKIVPGHLSIISLSSRIWSVIKMQCVHIGDDGVRASNEPSRCLKLYTHREGPYCPSLMTS